MNNRINQEILKFLIRNNPTAVAVIKGDENSKIFGRVEFYSVPRGVIVIADIEGLPQTQSNIFAFHIHEGEDCENNFQNTGGHYNPSNSQHPNHAGDMPPLFANSGDAWQIFFTQRFDIKKIIGKVVVIHEGVDDFKTQPSGDSGQKIACGIIKKY